MIAITRYPTPVPVNEGLAVLQLVGDNVTSLSMMHPPASHPYFPAYKLMLEREIGAYLSRPSPSSFELITATSSTGEVIGFLLFGFSDGVVGESGIYYTAVHRKFRRQGVLTLMMRDLLARYSICSLSCDIDLVPVYACFGFKPVGTRETQIVMALGEPKELLPVLDTSQFKTEGPVLAEQAAANARVGEHAVKRADKALKKDQNSRRAKVKQFLKSYW